jgi:hypothetical protein
VAQPPSNTLKPSSSPPVCIHRPNCIAIVFPQSH